MWTEGTSTWQVLSDLQPYKNNLFVIYKEDLFHMNDLTAQSWLKNGLYILCQPWHAMVFSISSLNVLNCINKIINMPPF